MSFIHIYHYKARILYCMIEIVISIWGFSLRSNLPMDDKNQESKYISQWWVGSILSPYFWYIYVLNEKLPNSDFELIAKACFQMASLGLKNLSLLYSVCVCVYTHFLSGSAVQNPPAVQELQEKLVRFLGQEDPLEEENDNPVHYSCLGNPMGRGTWQVTVHRVAKSWVHLKRLSS